MENKWKLLIMGFSLNYLCFHYEETFLLIGGFLFNNKLLHIHLAKERKDSDITKGFSPFLWAEQEKHPIPFKSVFQKPWSYLPIAFLEEMERL